MFEEIEAKKISMEAERKKIERLQKELQKKQNALRKDEEELVSIAERISIQDFLEGTQVRYVRIGEATCPNSETKESYGFVFVGHVAFLVWEKFITSNEGRLFLKKGGLVRKMQSVCMCGCGLDAEKEDKDSYRIEDISEDATICKGFFAKPIIEKCLEKANELGISVIFSRHANRVLRIGKIYFREMTHFKCFIPLMGRENVKDFCPGGSIEVS